MIPLLSTVLHWTLIKQTCKPKPAPNRNSNFIALHVGAQLPDLSAIGKRHEECCLLLRFHELTYQSRNLVCLGVEREVPRVEHVHLRLRHIFAIAFRLSRIE